MVARVRQSDIARRAQVSQTAVSLVINEKARQYGISADTEQRIQDAIAELGYAPDVRAQALRGNRRGLIGVHTFEPLFPTGPDHYYYDFLVGIEQQATEAGQDLALITSAHQHGHDQSIWRGGTNRLRIADGAVILGFHEYDEELAELARQRFPFVFIGRRQKAAKLMPYVAPDYAGGVTRTVDLIAEYGHRRVCYVGSPNRTQPRTERLTTFTKACRRSKITCDTPQLLQPRSLTAAWATSVLRDGVSAVVVESNRHVEEIGTACAAAGIDIPGELSVICLDSLRYQSSRPWTHMQTPGRDLGARSVDILMGLLSGHLRRDYHELVDCPIESGTTLAPPPTP